MKKTLIVTIDGPSASGKTTVSRAVARDIGWPWLSTGAFYRGLFYVAQKENVSVEKEQALVDLVCPLLWQVKWGQKHTQVFYKGRDVTEFIKGEEVGYGASRVSQYPLVRQALLEGQRDFARQEYKGLIVEGRDCGTVVFPKAFLKFFLQADEKTRAFRRAQEAGEQIDQIKMKQIDRDMRDIQRTTAPLQVPEGAVEIDTGSKSLSEVIECVINSVKKF